MVNDFRIINTGLSSDKALSVLNSVIGQLSDGIWENSSNTESYWKDLSIERYNDTTIVFHVSRYDRYDSYTRKYYKNYYKGKSDIDILKFWLRKIKAVFLTEQKYYPQRDLYWSKNCNEVLRYFHDNLTVSDVYVVYNEFKSYIKKVEAKQILLSR